MADITTRPPQRRTQQERRAATQQRVLDAAIDCLIDYGYAGLTTSRVADRAGVSRGAQLHQYPTREALVVAAVEHLAHRRATDLRQMAARLPANADRTATALNLLWSLFSGPLFLAGVELWVAARTDHVLRDSLLPFERDLRRLARDLVTDLFGPPATDHPDFHDVVALVLNTMHGAALQRILQPSIIFKRQQQLLERAVRALLTMHPGGEAAGG
jgi:AcrR family transcriptional regulator